MRLPYVAPTGRNGKTSLDLLATAIGGAGAPSSLGAKASGTLQGLVVLECGDGKRPTLSQARAAQTSGGMSSSRPSGMNTQRRSAVRGTTTSRLSASLLTWIGVMANAFKHQTPGGPEALAVVAHRTTTGRSFTNNLIPSHAHAG